ncbi:hypothetical protein [Rhizobium sp. G21]|uniref:hypothetical protein n=1 Tax=Rhizobium sp. G21 TaxID=2758439 RepID=UPI0015FF801C|nr:hypothetical protein [Rhizobium sp. G21]MBB1248360.1 hypothetical protein [Rhizobium sp. G21]
MILYVRRKIHAITESTQYDKPILTQPERDIIIDMSCTKINLYYKYLRQEIEREDQITHQRLTWSMTFQGFLISALAALMALSWDGPVEIVILRKLSLMAISIIGLRVAILSFAGIQASRKSIELTKLNWDIRNKIWGLYPNFAPQPCGQNGVFSTGTQFTTEIPKHFIYMWTLFLFGYVSIGYITDVLPCADAGDALQCVWKNIGAGKTSPDTL